MVEKVGVLALQGDFAEHIAVLHRLGVNAIEVRTPEELEECEALILPGGESTTIIKLLDRFDLRDRLKKKIENGMPTFGTCAGGIILARSSSDGEEPLGLVDIDVIRNAYGRQVDSFEAEIEVNEIGMVRGVFIRAPVIDATGPRVETLGRWADRPVVVRQGNIMVSTFHPELSGDDRLHRFFIERVR